MSHHLAPAHHADRVGDIHDFAQLVGDQDDRFPFLAKPPENAEQLIGFRRGQHAGGFIQNQDICPAIERLEDLDTLLHAHAKLFDHGIRIHLQTVLFFQRNQLFACLAERWCQQAAIFCAKNNVFQNCEILDQLEMLEHHADACRNRGLAVGDVCLLPADEDFTGVRFVESVENAHQRGFSGTVLTNNAVDRSAGDTDRDVLVGLNRTKGFGNAFQFDGGGLGHVLGILEKPIKRVRRPALSSSATYWPVMNDAPSFMKVTAARS